LNQWRHVDEPGTKKAPGDRHVLIARPSGFINTPWEVRTALNDPLRGWVDPGGNRLSESGAEPVYWQEAPEQPGCKNCLNYSGGYKAPRCEAADREIPPEVVDLGCEHFLGDIPF